MKAQSIARTMLKTPSQIYLQTGVYLSDFYTTPSNPTGFSSRCPQPPHRMFKA
jgi:hypothetical protein